MILGTAGHIDHGKTALVRALTGVDTDRLPEEKRRGITIDLGFAPLDLGDLGTLGIVDVPGHEGFVRTMLAGASGVDLAMLVVAADEGIMPQTREHLEILSLLNIPRGVVAVTKCDIADPEWRELVVEEIASLLKGTFLDGAPIVQVSATTGEGIDELKAAIRTVAGMQTQQRSPDDLFRMPVDRVFTVRGTGTVVTGTVWSGTVARDSTVLIQPSGKVARVRAIQTHGIAEAHALPGTRVALALAGCDLDDVGRGSVIVNEPAWLPTREMDVRLELNAPDFEPTPRTRVRLHIGTSETTARLSRLSVATNGAVLARLILEEPVVARGGDHFVIRLPSPARTIGGGVVIDPSPPRKKASGPNGAGLSDRKENRFSNILGNAGLAGVSLAHLPVRSGLPIGEVKVELARIGAVVLEGQVWGSGIPDELEQFIEHFLARTVANHPLEPGVSLQTIRAAAQAPPEVMDLALSRLVRKGRIDQEGALVRPAGWASSLTEQDKVHSDGILAELEATPQEPPSVGELEVKFGQSTLALLRWLEREGRVERVADDRYYSRPAVEAAVAKLRSHLEPNRVYSPAELREVLGVSRKYLIPFLEYCDRRHVTERSLQGRAVKPFSG